MVLIIDSIILHKAHSNRQTAQIFTLKINLLIEDSVKISVELETNKPVKSENINRFEADRQCSIK